MTWRQYLAETPETCREVTLRCNRSGSFLLTPETNTETSKCFESVRPDELDHEIPEVLDLTEDVIVWNDEVWTR